MIKSRKQITNYLRKICKSQILKKKLKRKRKMFLVKKKKIKIQILLNKTSKDLKRKNQRKTRRIRRTRIKKRSKRRLKQVKIAKQMILMSSSQFTRSNKCGLPTRLTA